MNAPVFACITPHPPILVPQVGRGQEREAADTLAAFGHLRDGLAATEPETLLIFAPHGPLAADTFHVLVTDLHGGLQRFGAALEFARTRDADIAQAILHAADRHGLPVRAVSTWNSDDHSTWVPLSFLGEAAPEARVVMIMPAMQPAADHYRFGQVLADVIAGSSRRIAMIASADGSHTVRAEGPYGFHPAGPRFETEWRAAVEAWDHERLYAMQEGFRRDAAEDCVSPLAMLMGALSRHEVKPTVLASEAPWGVGYTSVAVEIGAARTGADLARLARWSVTASVLRIANAEEAAPPVAADWRSKRAASFVTITDRHGVLRGCVGTVQPVQPSVDLEIAANAVAAASADPRFPPVRASELAELVYKVDVLSEPEPIPGPEALDPGHYGVVVEADGRRGLLLPDIEGIDDAEQQVAIARDKAGIGPGERVQLFRFTVDRDHE